MNITFLIGNGFDIAAGLDTSYTSFYRWYFEQPSEKEHIREFKEMIREDIENGGEYWSDFEVGLGKYTEKFSSETVGNYLDCFDDAQQSIVLYLDNLCKELEYCSDKDTIKALKSAIATYYVGINPAEARTIRQLLDADQVNNSEIHFISFNYTDILDRYVKMISENCLQTWKYGNGDRFLKVHPSVIHVHGFSNNYPILGVNDKSQVANQALLKEMNFSDILIKPKSVASLGQLWHEQAETTIGQSQIICIYGMSLGATDAKWWRQLIEWLKANNNRHIIIFWHSKIVLNTISTRNRFMAESEVINKFFSYSNVDAPIRDKLKSRIHVCINNEELFPMKLKETKKTRQDTAALTVVDGTLVLR